MVSLTKPLSSRCWVCAGMRMGFDMRQQAMAAVQAKVLRLNSAAIADVTSGKVSFTISPLIWLPIWLPVR